MKKLVILSSRFPYPLEKGDKLRLYHQLKYLSQSFEVHLFSIIEQDILQGVAKEVTKYCKSFQYFKISRPSQAMGLGLNIFGTLPFQVRYFYDKHIKESIHESIASIKPDVVYCQLIRMAPYARKLNYPLVIDYMDAFSLIMERQQQSATKFYKKWFYRIEAKRLKKYESKVQAEFKSRTIISEQDRKALQHVDNLEVISNGVDTEYFAQSESSKSYDILFAGNMGYKPNVSAAKHLVNEIVQSDDYKILIAGARPIYEVEQLASKTVTVSGWMEDIREAYYKSKIFVAPLFEGAGQQNKILQAMAMGIPCITTSIVNNAIGAQEDKEILIADDIPTFKSQISKLLNSDQLRNKLSENARKLVKDQYSWENQNDKLVAILNAVT